MLITVIEKQPSVICHRTAFLVVQQAKLFYERSTITTT